MFPVTNFLFSRMVQDMPTIRFLCKKSTGNACTDTLYDSKVTNLPEMRDRFHSLLMIVNSMRIMCDARSSVRCYDHIQNTSLTERNNYHIRWQCIFGNNIFYNKLAETLIGFGILITSRIDYQLIPTCCSAILVILLIYKIAPYYVAIIRYN